MTKDSKQENESKEAHSTAKSENPSASGATQARATQSGAMHLTNDPSKAPSPDTKPDTREAEVAGRQAALARNQKRLKEAEEAKKKEAEAQKNK